MRIHPSSRQQAGFTIVELVTVMIVVGVLAAVVLPRWQSFSEFEAIGFRNETTSLLRFAQKAAIAQRRNVCVAFSAAGVALTIDTSVPADGSCDGALSLPNAPRGGTGLGASVAALRFTSLGGTDQAANVSVTFAGDPAALTIDRVTGHVY